MHGTIAIIAEAAALPVQDRIKIVESLLRTLNGPSNEMGAAWATTARQRLDEIRSGEVQAVPAENVFRNAQKRLNL